MLDDIFNASIDCREATSETREVLTGPDMRPATCFNLGQHPNAGWSVSLRNVCKKFAGRVVLDDVSLELSPGEVLAVCGPSGAGKSTLLRTINGLETVDSGIISIGQHQITNVSAGKLRSLRSHVGFVFQQFNLYPHKNVLENVMLAPRLVRNSPKDEILTRAQELLDWVGLSHRLHAYPVQLSGGEQQRVAIVRSLIMDPKVLLLDEPTASLDRELKFEVLQVLTKLAIEGRTIVLCTHELEFAEQIAHRMLFMDKGRVIEIGTPDQVLRSPKHERTMSFMNKLTASPQLVSA